MKNLLTLSSLAVVVLSFSGFSSTALADDDQRPNHFKGEPSETLEQAVANFSTYNQQLNELLKGELTAEKMGEIHQLTYTLENALGKINDEMDELADVLEEVHLGSETMDQPRVSENGEKYLNNAAKVIK